MLRSPPERKARERCVQCFVQHRVKKSLYILSHKLSMKSMKMRIILLFVISIFFSCNKVKRDVISDKLIIEQSEDLTLAFGRELYTMMSEVQSAQMRGCELKDEARESEALFLDYQAFLEKMNKASRDQISEIVKAESKKLQARTAYKMKYYKFKQVDIDGLEALSDKAFNSYVKSKIAEKYWECTGTIMFRIYRECRTGDNNL